MLNRNDGEGEVLDPESRTNDRGFPVVSINTFQRQQGLITEGLEKSLRNAQGVIQTFIHPVMEDENYRGILLRTRWRDDEEQLLYCMAIAECEETGAKKTLKMLINILHARAAGIQNQIWDWVGNTITQTTFVNKQLQGKMKNDNNRNGSTSPIT